MRSGDALAELLAPRAAARFLADHFGVKPYVVRGDLRRLPEWLRDPDLRRLEAISKQAGGQVVASSPHHPNVVRLSHSSAGAVHVPHAMGLTQSFGDIRPHNSAAREWLQRLDTSLGLPRGTCRVGIFVSPPGSGLQFHYDNYDLFIVQLHGAKSWSLAPNKHVASPAYYQYLPGFAPRADHYPQMPDGFPEADPTPSQRIRLTAGSLLYVPRGWWHRTEASRSSSISASILLGDVTNIDVMLAQLRKLMLQLPELRAQPFGLTGTGHFAERYDADTLIARLGELVAKMSASDLRSASGAISIDGATRVQRNPAVELKLTRSRLAIIDRTVTVGVEVARHEVSVAHVLPAARAIVRRRAAFALSDLVDISDLRVRSLVETLLARHALVVLPFPDLR